jgi:hypothetical protein
MFWRRYGKIIKLLSNNQINDNRFGVTPENAPGFIDSHVSSASTCESPTNNNPNSDSYNR